MGSQWIIYGTFMGLSIFPMGSTTHFLHLCVLFTHSLVALKKGRPPLNTAGFPASVESISMAVVD